MDDRVSRAMVTSNISDFPCVPPLPLSCVCPSRSVAASTGGGGEQSSPEASPGRQGQRGSQTGRPGGGRGPRRRRGHPGRRGSPGGGAGAGPAGRVLPGPLREGRVLGWSSLGAGLGAGRLRSPPEAL